MKKWLLIILAYCLCLTACKSREDQALGNQPRSEGIAAQNREALTAYEEGRIEDSLKQYAEVMKQNPLDMEARIGSAKCQIALENYELAAVNLSSATRVNPREEQIYDLYIQLSEASNDISYANIAVNLAKTYKIQSFLDRVPEAPIINLPEGRYDSRLEVSITAEEGADIYFLEKKDNSYKGEGRYAVPLSITNGKTDLEVYCVKDGIPSEPVTAQYICQYEPTEITFEDPVFERMVRASIDNFNRPITDVECEQITRLEQYSMSNGMDYREYKALRIHTLNDLKWFPNLEILCLNNQDQIADFNPIAYCRSLYALELRYCNLTDISFAAGLSGLSGLGINGNKIADLSPLLSLTNIYSLDIDGNPVMDLEVIRGMDIGSLWVDADQISDPSILGSLKNLESMGIYECGEFDFSCLGDIHIPTLTRLYLYAYDSVGSRDEISPIQDISFLQNLSQIESLNIYGLADFSQIEVVKDLTNLTYLQFRTLDYKNPPEELLRDLRASLPGCQIN